MSVKTWIEEFYPVKASAGMTDKEALEHAILKFEGAKKENLKKHNVFLDDAEMYEKDTNDIFYFTSDECSLCLKYINEECRGCPLYENNQYNRCGNLSSPYTEFCDTNNSNSMLETLKTSIKDYK